MSYPQIDATQDDGSETATLNTRHIDMVIQISGQQLRPFETEKITIRADEDAQASVDYDSAGQFGTGYNKYDVSAVNPNASTLVIVLKGKGRDLEKALPDVSTRENALFLSSPKLFQDSANPSRVFVKMGVNPKVLGGPDDPQAQIKVTYVFFQSKGASDRDYKQVGARTEIIDPSRIQDFEINLWGAGRNKHTKVDLYFNIIGSKLYSEKTFQLMSNHWHFDFNGGEQLHLLTK